jgi:hypothetical protein
MVPASRVAAAGFAAVFSGFVLDASQTSQTETWPKGWEEMEIEAKWELTAGQYDQVVAYFPDNAERYGLRANVRTSGVPRRFVDHYYDDDIKGGSLAKARHVFRHRTRSSPEGMSAKSSLSDLIGATWKKDWQKVQYKSDPCRIDATWFRKESGECNLTDAGGEDLCEGAPYTAADLLAGKHPEHSAVRAMAADHPKVALGSLEPFLTVVDYRYRVELRDASKVAIYELSMDRIVEDNSPDKVSYELEIEHLDKPARPTVLKLLEIAADLQRRFALKPSVTSKGGTEDVGACVAAGAR